MNLQVPSGNDISQTRNRSRNVAPYSGLCTRCLDTCLGNCEVFKASMRGREVIYPEPFGDLTGGQEPSFEQSYTTCPKTVLTAEKADRVAVERPSRAGAHAFGIEEFGDSSINLGMRYWVPTKQYFQTLYQVNLEVHKALTKARITIPFPQRDVHMVSKSDSQ